MVMSNYILLIGCFLAGMALRHFNKVPPDGHLTLNAFIIHVSLPALTLNYVHSLNYTSDLLPAVAMPWLVFLVGLVVFCVAAKAFKLSRQTTAALVLTGGLGNTSFLGIPMLESFLGSQSVPYAVLIDQLGTYLVLCVLGLAVVGFCAGDVPTVKGVFNRIFSFPPFLALLAALLLHPVAFPEGLTKVLGRLGDTIAPLALVSVGLQMSLASVRANQLPLALGLAFKLVAAPLLVMVLYRYFGWAEGILGTAIILEAAMAPQIGGAIVAMQNKLNPPLVVLMLGLGIPASFVTVPLWNWALVG